MLLQALWKYADARKLLADLPFQSRTVHWLIPLTGDGSLRGTGFVPLSTPVTKRKQTKEEPGRGFLLPRFPGENNGGKAYYLAESFHALLGVRKEIGEPLPTADKPKGKDRNPVLAHRHFWQRIADAHARTGDPRLKSLLAFRERYLPEKDGYVTRFAWLDWRPNERAKKAEPEWHGRTATEVWVPLGKMPTVGFEIDGYGPLVVPEVGWDADPLWSDWAATYCREAFAEPGEDAGNDGAGATICLVTGAVGRPVARSHKPKILGIPGLASGGYVVSFAREAPAFSSYGFEMGANAPVSEDAAAAYALALNDLLASDDTSFGVGGVTFCFWAEKQTSAAGMKFSQLAVANPKAVADFLKEPFSGIDQPLARRERFLSVALSANAGRVVVREWLNVTLADAVESIADWFRDLEITALGGPAKEDGSGPYSLFRLAAAVVRDSSELDRVSEAIAGLYRAALENVPVPVTLLGPVLAEFQSALVTDSPKKPKYPFNQSRFALIKLILTRNPKGGFTPMPYLCDTDDAPYNLGRLLCLMANLQDAAHEYELEGAGIVERYYGTASSSPAGVFAILWKLHNHHLRKLEQQGDRGQAAAFAIRGRIAEIVAKFPCGGTGQPPRFPRQLSLEEQGRFALGYYQQMAADQQARRDAAAAKKTVS